MGVGIFQHKDNKLVSAAIGKNPWDYRIGTPQRFNRSLIALVAHSSVLAKAKPLVEFFTKLVWAFTNIKTIKQIVQPLERSLVLIESVHRIDVLFLVAIASHTAELATAKPLVEFLFKWVWVFFNTKAINLIAQP
jgi:hypothetical protein